jgi:hypothetical protein
VTTQNKMFVLTVVILVLLMGAGAVGDSGWWKHRREAQRQEKLQERLRTVGADATVTGSLLYGAWKQCRVIGYQDIEACSKQSGPLIREQAAAAAAGQALGFRDSYLQNCRAGYANDYCVALLQRAVDIDQNAEALSRPVLPTIRSVRLPIRVAEQCRPNGKTPIPTRT